MDTVMQGLLAEYHTLLELQELIPPWCDARAEVEEKIDSLVVQMAEASSTSSEWPT